MNTHICLTPDELYEVTGFRRASKQIEALAIMDIPFKVRPDGSPFVARIAVNDPEDKASARELKAVLNLSS